MDRRNKALQKSLRPLKSGEKLVVYSTAKTFDSEGDMYEHITGHRSKIIDEAEKKRG